VRLWRDFGLQYGSNEMAASTHSLLLRCADSSRHGGASWVINELCPAVVAAYRVGCTGFGWLHVGLMMHPVELQMKLYMHVRQPV
jgi:hypothetical protein